MSSSQKCDLGTVGSPQTLSRDLLKLVYFQNKIVDKPEKMDKHAGMMTYFLSGVQPDYFPVLAVSLGCAL